TTGWWWATTRAATAACAPTSCASPTSPLVPAYHAARSSPRRAPRTWAPRSRGSCASTCASRPGRWRSCHRRSACFSSPRARDLPGARDLPEADAGVVALRLGRGDEDDRALGPCEAPGYLEQARPDAATLVRAHDGE